MLELSAYPALFLAAFAAATLLPAQSEALLVGLLLGGQHSPWLLLLVASAGNVLGSLLNWWLGGCVERFRQRRWFPVSARRLEKARQFYRRYGRWSLLLSWVPVIGDPLTVVAGVMREPWWSFLVIVTLAKAGRYLALLLATLGYLG